MNKRLLFYCPEVNFIIWAFKGFKGSFDDELKKGNQFIKFVLNSMIRIILVYYIYKMNYRS